MIRQRPINYPQICSISSRFEHRSCRQNGGLHPDEQLRPHARHRPRPREKHPCPNDNNRQPISALIYSRFYLSLLRLQIRCRKRSPLLPNSQPKCVFRSRGIFREKLFSKFFRKNPPFYEQCLCEKSILKEFRKVEIPLETKK